MAAPLSGAVAAAVGRAVGPLASNLRARHEAEQRTAMASTRAAWTEQVADAASVTRNPYIAAVPQDILDHPETDIDMLKGYCQERGITFGERPSLQVLRAKLMASNADVQTVWSLRMTSLAAAAMSERHEGDSHLAQFQVAIFHSPSVPPDGPAHLVVAGTVPVSAPPKLHRSPGGGRSKGTLPAPLSVPCPPERSQFRRPPAPVVPMLTFPTPPPVARHPPASSDVRDAIPSASDVHRPGGAARSPECADGAGPRESDRLYLQYCQAKRAEEAHDLEIQRNHQHSELKGMLVSLGQSMANVTGVIQAHAASATVAAQRHSDALVSISHQQGALRTALDTPAPTLASLRSAKRQKISGTPLGHSRPPAGPTPLTIQGAGSGIGAAPAARTTTVRRDMLFTATMEAELMESRMVSSPLAIQLQRIVRLAHVSPGKPGLFGSYVVYGLYEQAGREAADDPAVGVLSINKEKKKRMKNIIMNKADLYVRHLFWLRTVLPEVLQTPASEATSEKMEEFTMTPERCDRLQAALRLEAHKAKYPIDHVILTPVKARISTLREMISTLSADHGYESNVDVMLKTPPFAERLAEASRRIGPRYHTNPSVAAPSQPVSPQERPPASHPVSSSVSVEQLPVPT